MCVDGHREYEIRSEGDLITLAKYGIGLGAAISFDRNGIYEHWALFGGFDELGNAWVVHYGEEKGTKFDAARIVILVVLVVVVTVIVQRTVCSILSYLRSLQRILYNCRVIQYSLHNKYFN